MTQDNDTEGTEAQDESMDDSAVIRSLRKQNKDLEKLVNSAPTRESIEAEIRNELVRESAISEQLIALGHPAGMSAVLKGRLEGEPTRETVAAALASIGYTVEVDGAPAGDGGQSGQQSDLAKVTTLSNQVKSASQGGTTESVSQRINAASSREEITAIMDEAGLLTNQF